MPADKKSGFVTLVGRPNVGKSTLMNCLIGQKIAITSAKPQTTRNRIRTVFTDERGQIVFVDTPGMHKAKNKLGDYMMETVSKSIRDVDLICWLNSTGSAATTACACSGSSFRWTSGTRSCPARRRPSGTGF